MDRSNNHGDNLPPVHNLSLNQKPLKWRTETEYIDNETGEILNKKHIQKGTYIIIKTEKLKGQKNGNYYTRKYRNYCKRNNQLELKF